jgi:hypothetical protein
VGAFLGIKGLPVECSDHVQLDSGSVPVKALVLQVWAFCACG